MLTRSTFNALKKIFGSSLDDAARVAFAKAKPEAQLAQLRAVVPVEVADDLAVASFVLVFNVKSGLVTVGTPAHFAMRTALGLSDPLPWHKSRPPKNAWDMQDGNRVPSWLEESQSMGAIARTLTWEDLRAGPDVISAAIRAFFKIGGLEDLSDPRAVQASDPTMRLFIEGVGHSLIILRPEWHDGDGSPLKELPKGADTRSQAEIDDEHDRAEKLRRSEEARERNRIRREKELAEYGALRGTVMTKFRSDATAGLASDIAKSEFDAVSTAHEARVMKDLPEVTNAIFDLISASVVIPEGIGADEVAEIRKETSLKALALTVQLVLEDVNDHQPGWLRRLANGDFKFRGAPLKGEARAPGYVSKKEKAASRAIWRIYNEYGEDVLNFALSTIVGQKLSGPAQIVKMPDWLKAKGDGEIETGDTPVVAATLPPPPPPPATVPSLI
ncbi:MAG: hypothetical protein WC869_00975 [Phycisphaerae bacterium]|jgi:hypothetical protein